ncbi:MAG: hypothetical protein QRY74_02485 [Chlamydia sp.]
MQLILLFLFTLCASYSHGEESFDFEKPLFQAQIEAFQSLQDAHFLLRPIAPEWQTKCQKRWPNEAPQIIEFVDPLSKWPFKRIEYYQEGSLCIQRESDLFAPTVGQLSDQTLMGVMDGVDICYYADGAPSSITTYSRGKKHGIEKFFYQSGSLSLTRQYVDGAIIGDEISFWEKKRGLREIQQIRSFQNGKPNGLFTQFSESGEMIIEGFYRDGLLHGKMVYIIPEMNQEGTIFWFFGLVSDFSGKPAHSLFDTETKQPLLEAHYSMGVPHGNWKEWHRNGSVKKNLQYVKGEKEGELLEYDEEGNTIRSGVYLKGAPIGVHTLIQNRNYQIQDTYSSNGFSRHTITYNGKPIASYSKQGASLLCGEYITLYPESGQIHKRLHFDHGLLDGEQKEYFSSGGLASLSHFYQGKWQGVQREWDQNNDPLTISEWDSTGLHGVYKEYFRLNPSQIALSAIFSNGVLDGPYEKWYGNGQKAEESFWHKGEKEGSTQKWDEDGSLIYRAYYSQGVPDGTWTEWYSQGRLKREWQFMQGLLEGHAIEWHENGQKAGNELYKHGKLTGEKKRWSDDGTLCFQGSYSEGKAVGKHLSIYPLSNQIFIEEQFDMDGLYNGIQRSYYPNGGLQAVALYEHGVLDGIKEKYSESGEKILSLSYSKGLLHGPFMHTLPNGMVESRLYEEGLPSGEWTLMRSETGKAKIYSQATYERGLISGSYKEFYGDGELSLSIPFKDGLRDGKAIIYNNNGTPSVSTEYVRGMQEGEMLIYYPSGLLSKRSQFHHNHLDGEEVSYHENGREKSRSCYRAGFLDGAVSEHSEEGTLLYEGVYVKGKRDGIFRKYNSDGTLKIEFIYDSDRIVKKNRK